MVSFLNTRGNISTNHISSFPKKAEAHPGSLSAKYINQKAVILGGHFGIDNSLLPGGSMVRGSQRERRILPCGHPTVSQEVLLIKSGGNNTTSFASSLSA